MMTWDSVHSNAQNGGRAKGAVAIDAFPGLGKTTSVLDSAKKFHRREINEQGTDTSAGHDRHSLPDTPAGVTSAH